MSFFLAGLGVVQVQIWVDISGPATEHKARLVINGRPHQPRREMPRFRAGPAIHICYSLNRPRDEWSQRFSRPFKTDGKHKSGRENKRDVDHSSSAAAV